MNSSRRATIARTAALVAAPGPAPRAGVAQGAKLHSRPVRIVLGFAPGGGGHIDMPAVAAKLDMMWTGIGGGSPESFRTMFEHDDAKMGEVVKSTGIKAQ
jgi:hypothetical protein